MTTVNARQLEIIAALARNWSSGRYIVSAETLAVSLGYRPARKGILPVTSSLRAMERAGLVCRHAPEDQWCVAKWSLTENGMRHNP